MFNLHSASILITGSETLDGRVQDTNSYFLIETLAKSGFAVQHVLSCTDSADDLSACLSFLASKSSIVLISGGMGPTTDDLTREVVADWSGQPLELRSGVLEALQQRFKERKRTFDPANEKQALFPKESRVISNPTGTAAGFLVQARERIIIALPGIPSELKLMCEQSAIPALLELYPQAREAALQEAHLRVFGMTEASVSRSIHEAKLTGKIPGLQIAYQVKFPEVIVVFRAPHTIAPKDLQESADIAAQCLRESSVYSRKSKDSMAEAVHELLLTRRETLAVAESCSGGLLGTLLTDTPGSSAYFLGGVVSYSNSLKSGLLGVDPIALSTHGAVSATVAIAMAAGVRERCGSNYALSITGIAGPGGGTQDKPAGTFFVGYASAAGAKAFRCYYNADRWRVRLYSVWTALDVLRRELTGLSQLHPIAAL